MLPVVLGLGVHVADHRTHLRPAHAESRVTLLPGKIAANFVHPFGRDPFQSLDGLGERHDRRQGEQHVRVIRNAADREDVHGAIAPDLGHITPQPRLELWWDEIAAMIRAEHNMEEIGGVGVRHAARLAQPQGPSLRDWFAHIIIPSVRSAGLSWQGPPGLAGSAAGESLPELKALVNMARAVLRIRLTAFLYSDIHVAYKLA